IPICAAHGTDPRDLAASRIGEPGSHALHGADAGFRGSDSARWGARPGNPDGSNWSWRFARRTHTGYTHRGPGSGPLGGVLLRRLWTISDFVFVVALFLAFRCNAASSGIHHDVADVIIEHPDSGHGARPSARTGYGALHHDVHGDGAFRLTFCRSDGRSRRGSGYRNDRCRGVHWWSDPVWHSSSEGQGGSATLDCGADTGSR